MLTKTLCIAIVLIAGHTVLGVNLRKEMRDDLSRSKVTGCSKQSCDLKGTAPENYCKNREKIKGAKSVNPYLFCGCSLKDKGTLLKPDMEDATDRCEKPAEADSPRNGFCTMSDTENTDNPDGVPTFCIPSAGAGGEAAGGEGGEAAGGEGGEAAGGEAAGGEGGVEPIPDELPKPAAPQGCDESAQNFINLECASLTKESPDECKDAYKKCRPFIAEAVEKDLPRYDCVEKTGIFPCAFRPIKVELGGKSFCCPRQQEGEKGCEGLDPLYDAWPTCCVKLTEDRRCSDFFYNGHPKLDYFHSVMVDGKPVAEKYCCPDDFSIEEHLEKKAKEIEEEAKRLEEEAKKKAEAEKAASDAAAKAAALKAEQEAAREAKRREDEANRLRKEAELAEKRRKAAEEKAQREAERRAAKIKAQEERDEAKKKKDEKKAEEKEKAAEKAAEKQREEERIYAEWSLAMDEIKADDEHFRDRGCKQVEVGIFGGVGEILFKQKAQHPGCSDPKYPLQEQGASRPHIKDPKKPHTRGWFWCCKDTDWRKQCMNDCKAKGQTEGGNPCFTKCRVNVIYERFPDIAPDDPEQQELQESKAGAGGAAKGATPTGGESAASETSVSV